jgi:hypothetical protein
MLQDRKYWAKNDELYLSEVNGQKPPEDKFKRNRFINTQRKLDIPVTEKPTFK